MKHTKESIAQYCVDSKGDKYLAEQIARQFERVGFEVYDLSFHGGHCGHVGVSYWGGSVICAFHYGGCAKPTETTLEALTQMIDEMLGDEMLGDEYAIVREFIEWSRQIDANGIDSLVSRFKQHRTKRTVTIDDLKSAYAKHEGIDVDKIEVI